MNRQEFEAALDAGRVEIQTVGGKWYVVRRNGRTQTWKTKPNQFYTPIKWCFRNTGSVTEVNLNSGELRIGGQDGATV